MCYFLKFTPLSSAEASINLRCVYLISAAAKSIPHFLFCLLSVNGKWGTWREWSCAEDELFQQTRDCNDPAPKNGGLECQGNDVRAGDYCGPGKKDDVFCVPLCYPFAFQLMAIGMFGAHGFVMVKKIMQEQGNVIHLLQKMMGKTAQEKPKKQKRQLNAK